MNKKGQSNMNFYDYLDRNGNKSFDEVDFNEVDNLIMSTIVYLNFTNIVPSTKSKIKLMDAILKYITINKKKDIEKLGVAQGMAFKLIQMVMMSKRYRNIYVHHYHYITSNDTQFGAMTFLLTNRTKYIVFEGTDDLLSGWKEDFNMSYEFPVNAQKLAIDYLNEEIGLLDKNVYVGGHSKGGNLSLVSSMYAKKWKNRKIVTIYSNDGPGLRQSEFNSNEYKNVENRYKHIIPNNSYVGTLLTNGEYIVIKSSSNGLMCHAPGTWLIKDTEFVRTSQSKDSKKLEKDLNTIMDNLSNEEKKELSRQLFTGLEEAKIKSLTQINNINVVIDILKKIKNIDKKYLNILINIVKTFFIASI